MGAQLAIRAEREEMLWKIFKEIDTDGNDLIDQHEWKKTVEDAPERAGILCKFGVIERQELIGAFDTFATCDTMCGHKNINFTKFVQHLLEDQGIAASKRSVLKIRSQLHCMQ